MNLYAMAALLNENLTTVSCKFSDGGNTYIYKCEKSLAETLEENDVVIVSCSKRADSRLHIFGCVSPTNKECSINYAFVHEVHEDSEIDPNSGHEYQWLIQKVDLEHLAKLMNEEILLGKKLRKQQRDAYRRQMKHEFLKELDTTVDTVEELG